MRLRDVRKDMKLKDLEGKRYKVKRVSNKGILFYNSVGWHSPKNFVRASRLEEGEKVVLEEDERVVTIEYKTDQPDYKGREFLISVRLEATSELVYRLVKREDLRVRKYPDELEEGDRFVNMFGVTERVLARAYDEEDEDMVYLTKSEGGKVSKWNSRSISRKDILE
jgi:hypothetical protein